MACIEEKSLTVILNLSCKKGWITENEKLKVETTRTFNGKKIAMFELLNKMEYDDNAARLLLSLRCIDEINTPEHPERDENRLLLKIMSKLFENRLVTAEEMLECEEQLQYEKTAKELETSDRTDTNSKDTQGFVNNIEVTEIIKNPLQLSPVIKCVLQYLKFEEIKTSRLISKEWASIALSVLIPRSTITFDNSAGKGGPLTFLEVFSKRSEENKPLPFGSFTISTKYSPGNPLEELNTFFQIQQQYITELRLEGLYLFNGSGRIDSFDITPWISNSPMAIVNSKTETKLSVWTSSSYATKLSVQSSALSNVKDLVLHGCTVHLQDGIRISPISLVIRFTRDGNQLTELCVNDYINFTKAKKVTLSAEVKLSLDLSGCHELECLDLSDITLRNWTTSRWTVKELKLCGIPFTERTQMQIQELDVRFSQIDVSVLPHSLEILEISGIGERVLSTTQPIILYNLKKIKLRQLTTNNVSTFFQNAQFPNLTSLDMEATSYVQVTTAWLLSSTSVKILKLKGITIKNSKNGNLYLDKLVLHNYRPSEITQMCGTHIQAKELVVDYHYGYWEDLGLLGFTDVEFLDFLKSQKSSKDCGQRIYVGSFDRLMITKAESPLQTYFDSGKEFYVFENNLGKAIEHEEFDKLLD